MKPPGSSPDRPLASLPSCGPQVLDGLEQEANSRTPRKHKTRPHGKSKDENAGKSESKHQLSKKSSSISGAQPHHTPIPRSKQASSNSKMIEKMLEAPLMDLKDFEAGPDLAGRWRDVLTTKHQKDGQPRRGSTKGSTKGKGSKGSPSKKAT